MSDRLIEFHDAGKAAALYHLYMSRFSTMCVGDQAKLVAEAKRCVMTVPPSS